MWITRLAPVHGSPTQPRVAPPGSRSHIGRLIPVGIRLRSSPPTETGSRLWRVAVDHLARLLEVATPSGFASPGHQIAYQPFRRGRVPRRVGVEVGRDVPDAAAAVLPDEDANSSPRPRRRRTARGRRARRPAAPSPSGGGDWPRLDRTPAPAASATQATARRRVEHEDRAALAARIEHGAGACRRPVRTARPLDGRGEFRAGVTGARRHAPASPPARTTPGPARTALSGRRGSPRAGASTASTPACGHAAPRRGRRHDEEGSGTTARAARKTGVHARLPTPHPPDVQFGPARTAQRAALALDHLGLDRDPSSAAIATGGSRQLRRWVANVPGPAATTWRRMYRKPRWSNGAATCGGPCPPRSS